MEINCGLTPSVNCNINKFCPIESKYIFFFNDRINDFIFEFEKSIDSVLLLNVFSFWKRY